jgi:hypothetical protein
VAGQISVEPVGKLIFVRLRGTVTEGLLEECQQRMLAMVEATGCRRLLYDAREMYTPPLRVMLFQRQLDADLPDVDICRAIVVSNPRLAYMSRLAFGDGNYRVFYDSIGAATKWLQDPLRDGVDPSRAHERWFPPGPVERRVRERRLSDARVGSGRRASDQAA